MLDGKQHNWATKYFLLKIWALVNHMKLVCAIFTLYQIVICCFFQASEEGKTDNDNYFKISWATYCSRAILDSAKQTNDIFKFRIFLHPLFSQPLNGISCPNNNPHPGILANLKRPLKNITVRLFLRFCGTLFYSIYGSNQSLVFLNLSLAIRCRYAPGYFPNIFRTTFYQTTVDGCPHI